MNIALNNMTKDASNYVDLAFLSGLSSSEIDKLLFYSTSVF